MSDQPVAMAKLDVMFLEDADGWLHIRFSEAVDWVILEPVQALEMKTNLEQYLERVRARRSAQASGSRESVQ